MYAAEFRSTGSRSTDVFHTLLAGNTAQPPIDWPLANGPTAHSRASPKVAVNVRRSTPPPVIALHSSVDTSCGLRQVAAAGPPRPLRRPNERGVARWPRADRGDPRGPGQLE